MTFCPQSFHLQTFYSYALACQKANRTEAFLIAKNGEVLDHTFGIQNAPLSDHAEVQLQLPPVGFTYSIYATKAPCKDCTYDIIEKLSNQRRAFPFLWVFPTPNVTSKWFASQMEGEKLIHSRGYIHIPSLLPLSLWSLFGGVDDL